MSIDIAQEIQFPRKTYFAIVRRHKGRAIGYVLDVYPKERESFLKDHKSKSYRISEYSTLAEAEEAMRDMLGDSSSKVSHVQLKSEEQVVNVSRRKPQFNRS